MHLRFIIILFVCFVSIAGFCQMSDILSVRKKNGKIIKSFYRGSEITFQKKDGSYIHGFMKDIKNDSVFWIDYNIQAYVTTSRARLFNTLDTRVSGIAYQNSERIKVFEYHRFVRSKIRKLFKIGDVGAYSPAWFMGQNHQTPQDAVKAFNDTKAKTYVPFHYGTFDVSDEPMGEPEQILNKMNSDKEILGELRILKLGETLAV